MHRLDAAHLYRLALEKGSAGARYHAVDEEGIPFREIAAAIGRRLNLPVVSKSPEEAAAHFDWLAHFVAIDCPASCAQTQQQLGWRPTQVGLIPDLDHGTYFDASQTKHATQSHELNSSLFEVSVKMFFSNGPAEIQLVGTRSRVDYRGLFSGTGTLACALSLRRNHSILASPPPRTSCSQEDRFSF